MADHVRIEFSLDFQHLIPSSYRNLKKCNWEAFRTGLSNRLTKALIRYVPRPSPAQLDSIMGHLTRCIISSFEDACLIAFRSSRKVIPGWSPEVAKARTKVRTLKRLASKSGKVSHWDQYNTDLKEFKKLVKKAKFKGWKDFTSKVESLQAVSRFSKVLQLVESGDFGALKRNDGSYTSTPEETLDLLADTLIPSTETPPEPIPRLWSDVDIPPVDSS